MILGFSSLAGKINVLLRTKKIPYINLKSIGSGGARK